MFVLKAIKQNYLIDCLVVYIFLLDWLWAFSNWHHAPAGIMHRLASCTGWHHAPAGIMHPLASCTGPWHHALAGIMHRLAPPHAHMASCAHYQVMACQSVHQHTLKMVSKWHSNWVPTEFRTQNSVAELQQLSSWQKMPLRRQTQMRPSKLPFVDARTQSIFHTRQPFPF